MSTGWGGADLGETGVGGGDICLKVEFLDKL